MCPTLRQRYLMVYFLYRNKHTLLIAQLTERMCLHITVTDAFPRTPVTSPRIRITLVLLVTPVLLPLVLLTEPSLCKVGAAWIMARVLCFPWHFPTSDSMHKESLHSGIPTMKASALQLEDLRTVAHRLLIRMDRLLVVGIAVKCILA